MTLNYYSAINNTAILGTPNLPSRRGFHVTYGNEWATHASLA